MYCPNKKLMLFQFSTEKKFEKHNLERWSKTSWSEAKSLPQLRQRNVTNVEVRCLRLAQASSIIARVSYVGWILGTVL